MWGGVSGGEHGAWSGRARAFIWRADALHDTPLEGSSDVSNCIDLALNSTDTKTSLLGLLDKPDSYCKDCAHVVPRGDVHRRGGERGR